MRSTAPDPRPDDHGEPLRWTAPTLREVAAGAAGEGGGLVFDDGASSSAVS